MAFTWFFTKITVAIQGLLWFHMDLRIVFPVSVQNDIGVLIKTALNLQISLKDCGQLNSILPIQGH
jgi:hypothetical protein